VRRRVVLVIASPTTIDRPAVAALGKAHGFDPVFADSVIRASWPHRAETVELVVLLPPQDVLQALEMARSAFKHSIIAVGLGPPRAEHLPPRIMWNGGRVTTDVAPFVESIVALWSEGLSSPSPIDMWDEPTLEVVAISGLQEEAMNLLFVYGTFRRGEPNHALLTGARPLGNATTAPKYSLRDHGESAGLARHGTQAVVGELYAVEDDDLARLDRLAGPGLYDRAEIELANGRIVFAYLIPDHHSRHRAEVPGGDWAKWRRGL
jgi:gamma-glutamylaminecyclotransferase